MFLCQGAPNLDDSPSPSFPLLPPPIPNSPVPPEILLSCSEFPFCPRSSCVQILRVDFEILASSLGELAVAQDGRTRKFTVLDQL
ncbi:hypothetical protein BaRGS_00016813, partial [Batillaria attramentaria]